MKVGLIPPVPDLGRWESTGFHLLLSHLFEHDGYLSYYEARRREGDYLVLDNSAHEHGMGNAIQELLEQVRMTGAQEVVVPDVLFDRVGTVEGTRQALRWIATDGWMRYEAARRPRLMFVPQGQNASDWTRCLRELLQAWERFVIQAPVPVPPPVIGISKDYDTSYGRLADMILKWVLPHRKTYALDVHCLGWSSNLWSLSVVARSCRWVRSSDSAKPFVYAKNGILLEPGGHVPEYPRRASDYFTTPVQHGHEAIALRNVEVFKATASDELILKQ